MLALVVGIAGPQRTPDDAGVDTPLREGGFWLDSAAMLEVILACEESFDVALDPETDLTPEALSTIRTLADSIRAKRG